MKKLFKWIGILIGIPIGYVLITLLLALIPVNSQKDENPAVTVYILTNGVHTDLVFPYISETFDWSHYLDTNDTPSQIQKDRKSTRLNSSHVRISYAVFCLK